MQRQELIYIKIYTYFTAARDHLATARDYFAMAIVYIAVAREMRLAAATRFFFICMLSISVYTCLHVFTSVTFVYIRLHPCTSVYIRLHPFTSVYIRLHPFTSVYIRLHPFTSVYTFQHLFTWVRHDSCTLYYVNGALI